jgi:hypothetical protein
MRGAGGGFNQGIRLVDVGQGQCSPAVKDAQI